MCRRASWLPGRRQLAAPAQTGYVEPPRGICAAELANMSQIKRHRTGANSYCVQPESLPPPVLFRASGKESLQACLRRFG